MNDKKMRSTAEFQSRVQPWMLACFGAEIAADAQERNHRFLEEALELVQACGATQSEAHQLVDYVYGRPVGEKAQEVGGVMVTLAALCLAQGIEMHAAGETELARIWTKVEQIRAKQAAKPKHSPLPEHVAAKAILPDPWGCNACRHAECDRFDGPRQVECRAMADNACARHHAYPDLNEIREWVIEHRPAMTLRREPVDRYMRVLALLDGVIASGDAK